MEGLTGQAIDIFQHAVAAVQPQQFMRNCLEPGQIPADARILVMGAGKASAAMALEAERIWGDRISGGMVITNRQAPLPLQKIQQVQAAHPVPDGNSLLATDMLLKMIAGAKQAGSGLPKQDAHANLPAGSGLPQHGTHANLPAGSGLPRHEISKADGNTHANPPAGSGLPTSSPVPDQTVILFLLSGGASSLMADVPPGSSLTEVRQLFDGLLKSGADIREMNTVRKHLSRIKGGQLARHAYPTRIFTIILSDVPGNDPAVIGSGPTVPDPTTFADAWDILEKYRLTATLPDGLRQYLEQGLAGSIPETPKPGDPAFAHSRYTVAASNYLALEAAKHRAEALGYHTEILTDIATGDARTLGATFAQQAIDYKGPYPACLLAGGESTVVVKGSGLGGRNQELTLAAGITLKDAPHITFLSAGTDGIDGPTDSAGAVINAAVMLSAPDPFPFLENNDAYHFFEKTGTHLKIGPTNTNVMDVMVILIHDPTTHVLL